MNLIVTCARHLEGETEDEIIDCYAELYSIADNFNEEFLMDCYYFHDFNKKENLSI